MRISTSQIYTSGSLGIQRNQQGLYTLQNQMSTGRRVLTPADDPVAAAQALVVGQSKAIVAQHSDNQGAARAQVAQLESTLGTMGDLLQEVRERVVQAGNTILTHSDRGFIASELEARLAELVGLANTSDGTGQFMFSGYQGSVRPFAVTGSAAPAYPATTPPVTYAGDDGERLLQVGPSRQMATNLSGNDVFMNIKSGNGTFVTGVGAPNAGTATISATTVTNATDWKTALDTHGSFRFEFTGGNYQIYDASDTPLLGAPVAYASGTPIVLPPAPEAPGATVTITGPAPANGDRFSVMPDATFGGTNTGTGSIDAGSVINPAQWQTAVNTYGSLRIEFSVSAGKTQYQIYDAANNPLTAKADYSPGQEVSFSGAKVVISGQPAAGDQFTIKPSTAQSVFQTIQNLVGLLRQPVSSGDNTNTEYSNRLGFELTNLDRALDNINTGRAEAGSRLKELESLSSVSEDLTLQHSTTLSELQDLDYVEAISSFTQQQMQLEAAQKTFAQVSGLSLFNII